MSADIKISFVSLGCPKNLVESEVILGNLAQAGFIICEEPEYSDIIIINSCSFIKDARDEANEVINEAIYLKKEGKVKGVVISGCLAQMKKDDLYQQYPEVDGVVGFNSLDELKNLCINIKSGKNEKKFYYSKNRIIHDIGRLRITPRHFSYIRIAEGCSHRCSYCIIPEIRGEYISKPLDDIYKEAEEMARDGALELNLIAQDTTFYGHEKKDGIGLVNVIQKLASINDIRWIRLLYAHPLHITDELISAIAKEEKVVKYLDIPIQHSSDSILNGMKRGYTRDILSDLIIRLRSNIPNLILRTAMIVGFPGETEEDFADLLTFIKDIRFERLGVFGYSDEEGASSHKLKGKVPESEIERRVEEVMKVQSEIAFQFNESQIGSELECIIDRENEEGGYIGRTYGDAPDVDGGVFITGTEINIGDIVNSRITGFEGYDLIAEKLD